MRINHKNKVASKNVLATKKNNPKGTRSVYLSGEILNDPYVVSLATISVTYVIDYGYGKIKSHFKRHDSPLVAKCNFILNHPKGQICGADAEILQVEIEGKQTIIHKCSEFSAHVAPVADRRKISRLQKRSKYRK
ncbi:hypothetical protein L1D59_06150 [Pseudoalteromonas piscicida]|uniref:hypothetical protein n=1 Tax=Pseudoalteromonas piscicida TaxID=43662 RepID=UPI001EFD4C45|nr:hypothetical protein [Pseudoalteromonas piscicida]MCG9768183.1 hypothetical protein [Pseudoalteromonas piscicida]